MCCVGAAASVDDFGTNCGTARFVTRLNTSYADGMNAARSTKAPIIPFSAYPALLLDVTIVNTPSSYAVCYGYKSVLSGFDLDM